MEATVPEAKLDIAVLVAKLETKVEEAMLEIIILEAILEVDYIQLNHEDHIYAKTIITTRMTGYRTQRLQLLHATKTLEWFNEYIRLGKLMHYIVVSLSAKYAKHTIAHSTVNKFITFAKK